MPRNSTIARIFRTIKLSENIGSGFHKMFSGWASYYKMKPVVEGDFDYYKITFYMERKTELQARATEKSLKDTEIVREKTREKILRLFRENPLITTAEIAEKISITLKGVEWNIGKLKKEGFVKRVGPDKGGHWLVSNLPEGRDKK